MVEEKPLSATASVLLRAASGRKIDGDTLITAENIAEYTPSPQAVQVTARFFAERRFEVGPAVGISFSITGLASTFEEVFGATLGVGEKGSVQVLAPDGSAGYDLPLTGLPAAIRRHVVAVALEEPAEFGGFGGDMV